MTRLNKLEAAVILLAALMAVVALSGQDVKPPEIDMARVTQKIGLCALQLDQASDYAKLLAAENANLKAEIERLKKQ